MVRVAMFGLAAVLMLGGAALWYRCWASRKTCRDHANVGKAFAIQHVLAAHYELRGSYPERLEELYAVQGAQHY